MKKVVLACIGGLTPLLLLGALASATTTTSLDIGNSLVPVADRCTIAPIPADGYLERAIQCGRGKPSVRPCQGHSDLWPSHQVRPVSKPRVGSRQKNRRPLCQTRSGGDGSGGRFDAGTRSVAAKFPVTDIATEPASDSPDNDVTLIGDNDQPTLKTDCSRARSRNDYGHNWLPGRTRVYYDTTLLESLASTPIEQPIPARALYGCRRGGSSWTCRGSPAAPASLRAWTRGPTCTLRTYC